MVVVVGGRALAPSISDPRTQMLRVDNLLLRSLSRQPPQSPPIIFPFRHHCTALSTHGCFSLQKFAVQLLDLVYMYCLSAFNQLAKYDQYLITVLSPT